MSYLPAPTLKEKWDLERQVEKLKGDLAHNKELLDAAQAKLAKVTEFHSTHRAMSSDHGDVETCEGCWEEWPCDTYLMLTKEEN